MKNMRVKKAEFKGSYVDIESLPASGLPEIALAGRSNVGKSSLINCLANRRNLALTSSTPGKTRTINYYLFDDAWFLVDLPGYGYAAGGAYINRMSDYCAGCAHDPKQATGPRACPFNALYWDFIARHAGRFAANPRMAMPLKNLDRLGDTELTAIRHQATSLRANLDGV